MGGGGRGVIGNGNERGGAEAEGYKEGAYGFQYIYYIFIYKYIC